MITYEFLSPETLHEEDIAPLRGLIEQLVKHSVDLDRERVLAVMKQARLLVARNDERVIVGTASLYTIQLFTRLVGRIEDVVVDGSTRGQGVGRELMTRLMTEAKRLKMSRLFLTSHPTRVEANELYQKLGFVVYDTNSYRMDLV
jgi:N-acetylglutamate synthase-like GNAT family acetyltransferase